MKRSQDLSSRRRIARVGGSMVALVTVALIVAVLVTAVALTAAARVPAFAGGCATCHEIAPHVEAWRASSHANTGCSSCHDTYSWYQGPLHRITSLVADVSRFASREPTPAADPGPRHPDALGISDDVCLRCHSMTREPSTGDRVIIDHAEHARQNGSCLSCHMNTTHPDPEKDLTLVMMERCYECHTLTPAAGEPSGECAVCHPGHLRLTPASHEPPGAWKRPAHGDSAKADDTQCMMCHTETYCVGCHGVVMPHPPDFVQSHGDAPAGDFESCWMCHAPSEGMGPCSSCHHQGADPARPWIPQHMDVARVSGSSACLDCHKPRYCGSCHIRGRVEQ